MATSTATGEPKRREQKLADKREVAIQKILVEQEKRNKKERVAGQVVDGISKDKRAARDEDLDSESEVEQR